LSKIIKDLKFWVGFSKIPGLGRVRIGQLFDHFGDLEHAWQASSSELKNAGLDSKLITSIIGSRVKIDLDSEMDRLNKYKVTAICSVSPDYPPRLKEIIDYPPVLYVRGNLLKSDEVGVSVVGTRRISAYGRQVTEDIVADLSHNHITIISGLAKGTDSIAHRVCLDNGGRTLAVFACGLDIVYPAENAELARRIMSSGALISEYPLGTRPKAEHFPRRNRIMSGLSLGVLVIEAGEKSGALITAEQALSQNREVFAVPGSIFSPYSKGTNNLIQQQGAKLVSSYMDVLTELNLASVAQQLEMKEFLPVDKTESLILKYLTFEPQHVDEISRSTGLSPAVAVSTLSILELKGYIKQVGVMNFVLSKGVK
jgi:DNA processing protein